MADTTKELDYLRFFFTSEESLKDKDLLKNQAWSDYRRNVGTLFVLPFALQCAQISNINRPSRLGLFRYLRNLKVFAFIGASSLMFNEKLKLEKKWRYYDRFYPEPTQLQRTLVDEARVVKTLEAQGYEDRDLDEKLEMSPETRKTYEQMYQLPPQTYMEPEQDYNPPNVKTHYKGS